MNLLLLRQPTQDAPAGGFDPDVVWRTFGGLSESFLARLPYIVIGVIVFFVFLVVARLVKRALVIAGRRTRLDMTLADLLGRIASAVTTIIGLFVAAVVLFHDATGTRSGDIGRAEHIAQLRGEATPPAQRQQHGGAEGRKEAGASFPMSNKNE